MRRSGITEPGRGTVDGDPKVGERWPGPAISRRYDLGEFAEPSRK
jgi:hypothetical protein